MAFRISETDRFPFDSTDRSVWYAIITTIPDIKTYSFTSSKSGKTDFVEMIKELKCDKTNSLILGIWQGQWKTDLFILDGKMCIERIRELENVV